MNQRAKNILETLSWFDMFNYPLRAEEVFWYLINTETTLEAQVAENEQNKVVNALKDLLVDFKIALENELYFLAGHEKTVAVRAARQLESLKKIKRAQKVARILSAAPFVRAVALCNVLGYFNADAEDDIDFFIITKSGRIWTTRFVVVWLFKILGLRPNKKTIKNKFCFSFFVSEDNLNLENLKLKNDPYLSWWLAGLLVLWEEKGVFETFLKANAWNKKYLPNFLNRYLSAEVNEWRLSGAAGINFLKRLGENILGVVSEKIFRFLELKIMPQKIKELMNKTPGVFVNDKILKFHLNDTREKLANDYTERIKEL